MDGHSSGRRLRRRLISVASIGLLLGGALGCASGPRQATPAGEEHDVTVEAYQFNARFRRDGKPTTVKLNIYQTDSLIVFAGRAYLGKGAFKGQLTADSLLVYFPSSDEFVSEAVTDMAQTADCPLPLADLPVAEVLRNLPDSVAFDQSVTVAGNYTDPHHPRFVLFAGGCPWQVEIEYDRHDEGWRVKDFSFTDGRRITLTAGREHFKGSARISIERLDVAIPPTAVPISP